MDRNGGSRLIRIIRSQRIPGRDDGRLNTEVIVRGIVVPGYSYVNLDQTFRERIETRERERDTEPALAPRLPAGGERVGGRAEGGEKWKLRAPTNICTR